MIATYSLPAYSHARDDVRTGDPSGGRQHPAESEEEHRALLADTRELRRLLGDVADRLLHRLDRLDRRTDSRAADPGPQASADTLGASALPAVLAEAAQRVRLDRRLPAAFGRLREHPELAETLSCWLAHDREVRRTAKALHVHPNTVRYRLARVESLLDRSLSETAVLSALYLTALAYPQSLGLPPAPAPAAGTGRPPGPAPR